MSVAEGHLRELAETIGPRPATTDAEARAADYLEETFLRRGLEVERQEFDCPRTYSWTYVVYHLLTLAGAIASGFGPLRWPAAAVAAISAGLMWSDLDTRWGLSAIMPKGPSQNIIARRVPKLRRGETSRCVVIVAHYDSARASLAFSPALVKRFETTFGLMKWCTFLVVPLTLLSALPWAGSMQPWLWYATLAASAYLVVPLLINAHREIFMSPVSGANDNASGVAAMLTAMERIVPEPEEGYVPAARPVRHSAEEAIEADVIPEGALLSYAPAETPQEPLVDLGDEFSWGELPRHAQDQERFDLDEGGESDWGSAWDSEDDEPAGAAVSPSEGDTGGGDDSEVRRWLGLRKGFDAREEGRKIGSWDQFGDGDDDWGDKAGAAAHDVRDDDFAAVEAARIRRRVSEGTDHSLADKEIWFVATGAEEVGTWGMKALLDAYGTQLRGAFILNLDNVGAGALHWVTSEGMARRYSSDRRVSSVIKRIVREDELPVRSRPYRGLSTDATPALARGYKALSLMAFDINGRLPHWHWHTDTVENASIETIETAADLVVKFVRDA